MRRMEQESQEPRSWSITKSEWDGYGRESSPSAVISLIANVLFVLVGLALFTAPWVISRFVSSAPPREIVWFFRGLGGLFVACPIALHLWQRWAMRRWKAVQPLIWDSNGCVCPWCRVRVDESPCRAHGFSRDDQPTLLAYWEALPTRAFADNLRARATLIEGATRRPLHWRLIDPLRRARSASMVVAHDPAAAPLTRLRKSLPWMMVKLAVGVCVLAFAFKLLPRNIVVGLVSGCWPWLLIGPVLLMAGPMWRVGQLRCVGCGQLCASAQPTLCPECGADLTKPAAVVRHERVKSKPRIFVLSLFVLAMAMPLMQDALIKRLPTPLRNAIWTNLRPPTDYWRILAPSTMTQSQVDEAARLLIACAAPNGGRPLFTFAFMDNALKAGKLSAGVQEEAARTIVQAALEVEIQEGQYIAIVRPAFGELILPSTMTPRLVFGGVSVDGGPWSPSASWSLFNHDLDEYWRNNGQLRALPEDKLLFKAPLGELASGTHAIRARCWIVLHGNAWERSKPEFDSSGALVPPAGVTHYELPIEASLTVR